ncbi:hypothetical protein [Nitrosococcus wardiae]|uniref:Uncharacterized protein n=1 Tax=Nitrosococcus wardiae TaxID=1814290 RepID=A0A4P7C3P1_9GAMM|nr:hypothetical protein [Nitrosococcus wardiae]QBQ55556.1 hypothetical protein E3U44_14345 [Nitrosococcus wardiae]
MRISAGLNVTGFWQGDETVQGRVIAVILGCFVPGMVYALIQAMNAQQTDSKVPVKARAKERTKTQVRKLEAA